MALDPASGEIYLVTAEFGPAPAPTPEHPHPRAAPLAGSFFLIVVGRAGSTAAAHRASITRMPIATD
jgi:hypothetical protein